MKQNFRVNSDIFISDLEAKILYHLTVLKKEHSCHFHTYVSKISITQQTVTLSHTRMSGYYVSLMNKIMFP